MTLCPYIIHESFRGPRASLDGLLGSGAYPSASGRQDTLNEYYTKIIHVGQIVVFERKIEMLVPKGGRMDAGQAKTTDVHCSRPIWQIFDEPKDQKPDKDVPSAHTHNSESVPSESLPRI